MQKKRRNEGSIIATFLKDWPTEGAIIVENSIFSIKNKWAPSVSAYIIIEHILIDEIIIDLQEIRWQATSCRHVVRVNFKIVSFFFLLL